MNIVTVLKLYILVFVFEFLLFFFLKKFYSYCEEEALRVSHLPLGPSLLGEFLLILLLCNKFSLNPNLHFTILFIIYY